MMVKILRARGTIYSTNAFLVSDDYERFRHLYTGEKAEEAKRWIKLRGYYLQNDGGYTKINLEKDGYTIIRVTINNREDYHGIYAHLFPTFCICYAAVLLYRRLKRNGAIA